MSSYLQELVIFKLNEAKKKKNQMEDLDLLCLYCVSSRAAKTLVF